MEVVAVHGGIYYYTRDQLSAFRYTTSKHWGGEEALKMRLKL